MMDHQHRLPACRKKGEWPTIQVQVKESNRDDESLAAEGTAKLIFCPKTYELE